MFQMSFSVVSLLLWGFPALRLLSVLTYVIWFETIQYLKRDPFLFKLIPETTNGGKFCPLVKYIDCLQMPEYHRHIEHTFLVNLYYYSLLGSEMGGRCPCR